MNKNDNIVLISDDEKLSQILASKLILLRASDNVILSDYAKGIAAVENHRSKIVILHENKSAQETINYICELRADEENKDLSIILLVDSYNSDLILSAYDSGMTDFCSSNAADYELVIRAVNNIKTASVRFCASRNTKILEDLNVIDEITGFYTYSYAKHVVEKEINSKMADDGIFIAIAPAENSKTKFSMEKIGKIIASSVRCDDIVTLGKGAKFYIMLLDSNVTSATVVLNKIKSSYGDDFNLKAGMCSICDNFDEMEHNALKALSEAMYSHEDYIITHEKEDSLEDWLDGAEGKKDYKIFRQMFNKKMEKIIAPVFFRLQKAYEEKLFKTKIEQYTDEEQCVFRLKNEKQDSKLTICYPGFAKIVIYISHEGLDSPENNEITLPLAKITQKELIRIVEDFIKEFKLTAV